MFGNGAEHHDLSMTFTTAHEKAQAHQWLQKELMDNEHQMVQPGVIGNPAVEHLIQSASGKNEMMMEHYKQATEINGRNLRQARNLEELVNIRVQKVDGVKAQQNLAALAKIQSGGRAGMLDALGQVHRTQDPGQASFFRQKVPIMGDRRFLINQAVLSSSVASKRNPMRGPTANSESAAEKEKKRFLSSAGSTASFHRFKAQCDRVEKTGKDDDAGKIIDNFGGSTGGVQSQMADQISSGLQEINKNFDAKDSIPDPINALKSIFKQGEKKKRRVPLDLNPISSKYMAMRKKQEKQQLMTDRAQNGAPLSGKVFQEDHNLLSSQGGLPSEGPISQTPFADERDEPQIMTKPMTTKSIDVKAKLENLRKLFAEEDMNDALKDIQGDWSHKEQQQFDKEAMGMPQDAKFIPQDVDLPQNDLRNYLSDKIKQIQERSDPHKLINQEIPQHEQGKLQAVDRAEHEKAKLQNQKVKFQASTLTHIAQLKVHGQDKIEEQFIERKFREQSNYHIIKYDYQRQKDDIKHVNFMKKQQQQLAHEHADPFAGVVTTPINSDAPVGFKNRFSQFSQSERVSQASAMPHSTKTRQKSRFKKSSHNVETECMIKIDKINRGVEKGFKNQQPHYVANYGLEDEAGAAPPPQINTTHATQMNNKGDDSQEEQTQIREVKPLSTTDDQGKVSQQTHYSNMGMTSALPGRTSSVPEQTALQVDMRGQVIAAATQGDKETIMKIQDNINNQGETKNLPASSISSNVRSRADSKNKKETKLGSEEIVSMVETAKDEGQSDFDSPASPGDKLRSVQLGVVHQNLNNAMNDFKVSQLVNDYNQKNPHYGQIFENHDDAVMAQMAYMSDSELVSRTRKNFRQRPSMAETRGAGFFKNTKFGDQVSDNEDEKMKAMAQRWPPHHFERFKQLQNEQQDLVHGSQFQYFCPKRFNRFPRFTIFFKKDGDLQYPQGQNPYLAENTVSLSPQFLSYLMDRGEDVKLLEQKPVVELKDNVQKVVNQEGLNLMPRQNDAVTGWNQQADGNIQSYDPFERVVLIKGIDNSILTSFRTLKRENNTVSETFKIVHKKFQPSKNKSSNMRALKKNIGDQVGLYALTDNEDNLEVAQQELMAESILQDGDVINIQHRQPTSNNDLSELQKQIRQGIQSESHFDGRAPDIAHYDKRVTAAGRKNVTNTYPLKLSNPERSNDISKIGPHGGGSQNSSMGLGSMQPANVDYQDVSKFENTQEKIKLDALGNTGTQSPQIKKEHEASQPLNPTSRFTDKDKSYTASTQNKHQIEVMVLSKVDPLENFQRKDIINSSEAQLLKKESTNAQSSLVSQMLGQHERGKRNPFKGFEQTSNQDSMIITKEQKQNVESPFQVSSQVRTILRNNNTGNDVTAESLASRPAGIDGIQDLVTTPNQDINAVSPNESISKSDIKSIMKNRRQGMEDAVKQRRNKTKKEAHSQEPTKYGADFKIPELPPILQAQLFPDTQPISAGGMTTQTIFSPVTVGGNKQNNEPLGGQRPYKIKKFIDEIFQKEAKSRYHKQYVHEDFLSTKSAIFNLAKYHDLRPKDELISNVNYMKQAQKPNIGPIKNRFGGYNNRKDNIGQGFGFDQNQLDEFGKPAFYAESQSLTNVLGFQAGGPHVVNPLTAASPNPQMFVQEVNSSNEHTRSHVGKADQLITNHDNLSNSHAALASLGYNSMNQIISPKQQQIVVNAPGAYKPDTSKNQDQTAMNAKSATSPEYLSNENAGMASSGSRLDIMKQRPILATGGFGGSGSNVYDVVSEHEAHQNSSGLFGGTMPVINEQIRTGQQNI